MIIIKRDLETLNIIDIVDGNKKDYLISKGIKTIKLSELQAVSLERKIDFIIEYSDESSYEKDGWYKVKELKNLEKGDCLYLSEEEWLEIEGIDNIYILRKEDGTLFINKQTIRDIEDSEDSYNFNEEIREIKNYILGKREYTVLKEERGTNNLTDSEIEKFQKAKNKLVSKEVIESKGYILEYYTDN